MANGQYYSEAQDLYNIFGKKNINRYANPDNDGDQEKINDRMDWANSVAHEYTNGRFATSKYDIPFTCPYPKVIVIISASYAGKLLYDTRRIVEGDDNSRIAAQQMNMEMLIQQVMSGQLRLIDQKCNLLSNAKDYPIGYSSQVNEEKKTESQCCDPFGIQCQKYAS